jgi:large subunit ribosomal protein L19
MSTALSCTRASIPRAAIKVTRCRRFASTEAVAVETVHVPIISTQRPKRNEPLGVEMHRLLYPGHYEEKSGYWKPRKSVERVRRPAVESKRISAKWWPVMKEKGVQPNLSKSTIRTSIEMSHSQAAQLLEATSSEERNN